MKKAVCFFICALLLLMVCSAIAEETADLPQVPARAYVLIDQNSGRVLMKRNEDTLLPIASTTKIMTALLALENCALDEVVTTGPNAYGTPGTSIYLGLHETLTMEQMLQALLIRSANDAAVAVAEHIDGDVKTFAERMNARASALGADANFVTPNGLDASGNGASALGLALIAREAMQSAEFRRIVSIKNTILPWRDSPYDRVLTNKNKLLTTYEGATGIKTGFTGAAGRCLVFSAERDGMELIGVVLNCGTWFESAEAMLDYGFSNFTRRVIFDAEQVVTEVPVMSGAKQVAYAVCKSALAIPIAPEEEAVVLVDVPEVLTAPIERGAQIGRVWVEVDGQKVAEAPLVARDDVGEWGYVPALKKVVRNWVIDFT